MTLGTPGRRTVSGLDGSDIEILNPPGHPEDRGSDDGDIVSEVSFVVELIQRGNSWQFGVPERMRW